MSNLISLHPEDMYEGREPVSGRYKITDAKIAVVSGQQDDGDAYANVGLALKGEPVGHDVPLGDHPAFGDGYTFIKAGPAARMLPSNDGKVPTDTDSDGVYKPGSCLCANPEATKIGSLNGKSKLGLFIAALINGGADGDFLRTTQFAPGMVGMDLDLDEEKASFTNDQGKEQSYGFLTVRKVYGQDTAAGKKPAGRKGAAKKETADDGESIEKAVEVAAGVVEEAEDPVTLKAMAAAIFHKDSGVSDSVPKRQKFKREFAKGEGPFFEAVVESDAVEYDEDDGVFVAAE